MYDKLKLENILTEDKYRAIDDDGRPFKPSHNIYKMISDEIKNQGSIISTKHIYQILKCNRGGMLDALLKKFNVLPEVSVFEQKRFSDLQYSSTEKKDKSSNAKCHSTFEGKYSECGGILNGYLYLKPAKKGDAIFDCKLKNAPLNFKHTKK